MMDPMLQAIKRQKAKVNLLDYATLVNEKYIVTRFNRYLAWKLQKFVQDVEDGLDPFLVINMEPRAGKSELTSKILPSWVLGRFPDWELIVASYSGGLSGDFVDGARKYIIHPEYPFDTQIQYGRDSRSSFETTRYGRYFATSVKGGITGKGGNILILDDVFRSWKEAESEVTRDDIFNWYLSTFRTRKTPGKSGILAVSTRWHEDDLIGRILDLSKNEKEADQVEHIKFPAIAEEDEWLDGPDGRFLFRRKGEVLQPERKSLAEVSKDKATADVGIWEAVYQQDPTPSQGYIIQGDWFEDFTMNEIPQDLKVFSYSDTAYGLGQDNSCTIYGFVYKDTGYIVHVLMGDLTMPDFLSTAYSDMAVVPRNKLIIGCETSLPFCDYRTTHMIEPKATGHSVIQLAKRFSVIPDKTKELSDSKVVRVKACTGIWKARRIKLLKGASWKNQFLTRVKKFADTATHKDEADALAGWTRNFIANSSNSTPLSSSSVTLNSSTTGFYIESQSPVFYE